MKKYEMKLLFSWKLKHENGGNTAGLPQPKDYYRDKDWHGIVAVIDWPLNLQLMKSVSMCRKSYQYNYIPSM